MRQVKQEPKIGDFIVTNNEFSPDGSYLAKAGLPAVIVQKQNDKYLCRFGKGHSWTKNINNLLSDDTGYLLSEDEFELDNY